jgi:hypothetical protein
MVEKKLKKKKFVIDRLEEIHLVSGVKGVRPVTGEWGWTKSFCGEVGVMLVIF